MICKFFVAYPLNSYAMLDWSVSIVYDNFWASGDCVDSHNYGL